MFHYVVSRVGFLVELDRIHLHARGGNSLSAAMPTKTRRMDRGSLEIPLHNGNNWDGSGSDSPIMD